MASYYPSTWLLGQQRTGVIGRPIFGATTVRPGGPAAIGVQDALARPATPPPMAAGPAAMPSPQLPIDVHPPWGGQGGSGPGDGMTPSFEGSGFTPSEAAINNFAATVTGWGPAKLQRSTGETATDLSGLKNFGLTAAMMALGNPVVTAIDTANRWRMAHNAATGELGTLADTMSPEDFSNYLSDAAYDMRTNAFDPAYATMIGGIGLPSPPDAYSASLKAKRAIGIPYSGLITPVKQALGSLYSRGESAIGGMAHQSLERMGGQPASALGESTIGGMASQSLEGVGSQTTSASPGIATTQGLEGTAIAPPANVFDTVPGGAEAYSGGGGYYSGMGEQGYAGYSSLSGLGESGWGSAFGGGDSGWGDGRGWGD